MAEGASASVCEETDCAALMKIIGPGRLAAPCLPPCFEAARETLKRGAASVCSRGTLESVDPSLSSWGATTLTGATPRNKLSTTRQLISIRLTATTW